MSASVFAILATLNTQTMSEVPAHGGTLTEAVVGTSRFANPLLAISDTDKDLSMLTYSGLTRIMPDGTIGLDLAADLQVSEDGTIYTFTLRDDATFHDNTPVLARDVVFTVTTAQNPAIKSARFAEWDGVRVEATDDYTVQFTLPRAYAPFLEATTLGILPAHLWQNIDPVDFPFHELNKHPIGSGPYHIASIREDNTGTPTEYILRSFSNFTLGKPFINRLTLRVYATESDALHALERGDVESLAAITSQSVPNSGVILQTPLPRTFALFINESKSAALADVAVRRALNAAVDREALINEVLSGFGKPVHGPLPPHMTPEKPAEPTDFIASLEKAAQQLESAGWTLNEETGLRTNKNDEPLSVSITTADTAELSQTADIIAQTWRTLGITVTVKVFSTGDLNNTVIRPRDYEMLLFGEVVGHGSDLYAFWHSSQRNDPGLNLSLYTNATADRLLVEARRESDPLRREENLLEFAATVEEDVPAIFLYVPEFIYRIPDDLYGVSLGTLINAADRFASVHTWHREKERVWDIFITR